MTAAPASRRKYRVAYLVTHPIQYQAPMLRRLAAQPDFDLTVFFRSDVSVRSFYDREFKREIQWDVSLLDGYRYEFLPAFGRRDRTDPWNYGMASRLWRGKFDVLWVHGYAKWFNWIAIIAARMAGIRVLVRDEPNSISAPRSRLKVWLKRHIFFRALRAMCNGFLAIGTLNRNYYLENGIEPSKVFLVPYCVDNEYFARLAETAAPKRELLRAQLGLAAGRPVILYASKFTPRKRAMDLVAAFERLVIGATSAGRRPYLLLAGEGEMRPALEEHTRPLADDVRFLGFRNQSELPALFDLCDVFVLPSDHEPWGLVINEVMSVGRAVVVSDRVGCGPDLVKDGRNGFVFPVGNVAALVDALRRILIDRETIETMGAASREILSHWSLAEDVAGVRAAVQSVVGPP